MQNCIDSIYLRFMRSSTLGVGPIFISTHFLTIPLGNGWFFFYLSPLINWYITFVRHYYCIEPKHDCICYWSLVVLLAIVLYIVDVVIATSNYHIKILLLIMEEYQGTTPQYYYESEYNVQIHYMFPIIFFASTINSNVGVATHNDYWLIFILLVVFIMQFVILIITRKSQYRLCMLWVIMLLTTYNMYCNAPESKRRLRSTVHI
jgi:hypothetical protein